MTDAAPILLTIADKHLSSWSLRPWLALKMAGVAFEENLVRLDRPETADTIRPHSPSGLVPALRQGALTVWDSLAIIEFVHETLPAPGLWPADAAARAVARAASAEMHSGFRPLRQHLPMAFAHTGLGLSDAPGIQKDIDRIRTLWGSLRASYGRDGAFLFGAFCAADAMFAPVVSRFRSYGVPLDDPLQAYADAVWDLAPMREWLAGAQAELA